MIPRWLLDKRIATCLDCDCQTTCTARFGILHDAPECPLGRLVTLAEEIQARAWPDGAERASGCCDSAQNYLSQ
jgi:hypothetical protein